jgi:hypothetical protein
MPLFPFLLFVSAVPGLVRHTLSLIMLSRKGLNEVELKSVSIAPDSGCLL